MELFALCSVLLLPMSLCWGSDSEETLVKTIGGEPDVTPICTNSTLNIITLIVCKIRTERNRSEECRLLYQYGKDFEHLCDSRFKLILENQTVFLQLTGLTPVDSGNYSCECSTPDETFIQHLKVTVEDNEGTIGSTLTPQIQVSSFTVVVILTAVISIATVLITGVILQIFYRVKSNGGCTRSATYKVSEHETLEHGSLAEDDPDDPYTSLQQPTSDLYQTIRYPASNTVTAHLDNLKNSDRESHSSFTDYENI